MFTIFFAFISVVISMVVGIGAAALVDFASKLQDRNITRQANAIRKSNQEQRERRKKLMAPKFDFIGEFAGKLGSFDSKTAANW